MSDPQTGRDPRDGHATLWVAELAPVVGARRVVLADRHRGGGGGGDTTTGVVAEPAALGCVDLLALGTKLAGLLASLLLLLWLGGFGFALTIIDGGPVRVAEL